ncbi:MAG: alpha/beta hydrolase [Desulfobacterales bacterium]|nr:alpha/beta hydrolase [Desulfobacterales bacterium]
MEKRRHGEMAFTCGRWPLDPQRASLVFIHGAGESSLLWEAQVEGLRARANTLALDLPGRGASGGSPRRRIEDYAAAVADFLAGLGVPAPIPCGLSMGGAITQQLLLDYADRFAAGIIVSSGARLRVLPSLFDLIDTHMPGYVEMVDRLGFSPKTAAAVKRPFLEDSLKARPEVAHGDFEACDRFDAMGRLAQIAVPVLVVSAEDDKLTPPKYAEFLAQRIAAATRAHILDAGHFVPIEKPLEVNAAICRFLDAHGL